MQKLSKKAVALKKKKKTMYAELSFSLPLFKDDGGC